MTHDLRSPLEGIRYSIQKALESSTKEEANEYLSMALSNQSMLTNLVSDILDYC